MFEQLVLRSFASTACLAMPSGVGELDSENGSGLFCACSSPAEPGSELVLDLDKMLPVMPLLVPFICGRNWCEQVKKASGGDRRAGYWTCCMPLGPKIQFKSTIFSFLIPFRSLFHVIFASPKVWLGGNKFFPHEFLSFYLFFYGRLSISDL